MPVLRVEFAFLPVVIRWFQQFFPLADFPVLPAWHTGSPLRILSPDGLNPRGQAWRHGSSGGTGCLTHLLPNTAVTFRSRPHGRNASTKAPAGMRIGIYGGTFDPVHLGHLLLAEQCREACQLDQVWFMPAARSPHKQKAEPVAGKQRAEMLHFALAGMPEFVVCEQELKREGVSYTVDTLKRLHEDQPGDELFFLMGGDSLADLPRWREPERIAELAMIVAVNRGRTPLPQGDELRQLVGESIAERIQTVEMPACDVSATDIRNRIAAGRSIRFMTPRSVEVYLREHGLYGAPRPVDGEVP